MNETVQAEETGSREEKRRFVAGRELSARPVLAFFRVVPWGDSEASEPTCIRDRKFKKLRFMDRQATLQCDWPESRLKKIKQKASGPAAQESCSGFLGRNAHLAHAIFSFSQRSSPHLEH